jgi:hypothetical protein
MQTLQQAYPADYIAIKLMMSPLGSYRHSISSLNPLPLWFKNYFIFTLIASRGTVMYIIYDNIHDTLNICHDNVEFNGFGHMAPFSELISLIRCNKEKIIHGLDLYHISPTSFIRYCDQNNI